jgi:hypothetical protein
MFKSLTDQAGEQTYAASGNQAGTLAFKILHLLENALFFLKFHSQSEI